MDPPRLSTFVLAKSKVASVKAAEDAKKKKAEEDASKVLQSFVESFDTSAAVQRSSTWIRGGVEGGKAIDPKPAQEQVYEMKVKPAMTIFEDDDAAEPTTSQSAAVESSVAGPAARRRQMDAFLAELKDRHERADGPSATSSAAWETDTTSNISIRNLSPTVTEEVLSRLCTPFGPVASIKIMWPRTEEERARGKNTGFVLYARRRDAEAAMDALQDYYLEGMRLLLGWAKGVRATTAASTVYVPASQAVSTGPVTTAGVVAAPPANSGLHAHAMRGSLGDVHPAAQGGQRRKTVAFGGVHRTVRTGWDAKEEVVRGDIHLPIAPLIPENASTIRVQPPADLSTKRCADMWATYLLADGQAMEGALHAWYRQHEEEREADGALGRANPDVSALYSMHFPWLDDPRGDVAVYTRWRVWSLAQGDTLRAWRMAPFQCTAGGAWWVPPPCPSAEDLLEAEAEDLVQLLGAEGRESGRAGMKRGRSDSTVGREEKGKLTIDQQAEWASLLSFRSPPGGGPHADMGSGTGSGDDSEEGEEDEQSPHYAEGRRGDSSGQRRKGLSLSTRAVHAAMLFALDHADCASQVVSILSMALREDGAAVPLLVARLYVAADILAASATAQVKNASSYRSALQGILPFAFEYLGGRLRHGGAGRISKEAYRERVLRVLAAWEKSFVFPALFVTGLEATFLRPHDIPTQVQGQAGEGGGGAGLQVERQELERRCRLSGVACEGDAADLQARLDWINEYVKVRMGLAGSDGSASLHEDLVALTKEVGTLPLPMPAAIPEASSTIKRRKKGAGAVQQQAVGSWQEVSGNTEDPPVPVPVPSPASAPSGSPPLDISANPPSTHSTMGMPYPHLVQPQWTVAAPAGALAPPMHMPPMGYGMPVPTTGIAAGPCSGAPGYSTQHVLPHATSHAPGQAVSAQQSTATSAQQLLSAALSAALSATGQYGTR